MIIESQFGMAFLLKPNDPQSFASIHIWSTCWAVTLENWLSRLVPAVPWYTGKANDKYKSQGAPEENVMRQSHRWYRIIVLLTCHSTATNHSLDLVTLHYCLGMMDRLQRELARRWPCCHPHPWNDSSYPASGVVCHTTPCGSHRRW